MKMNPNYNDTHCMPSNICVLRQFLKLAFQLQILALQVVIKTLEKCFVQTDTRLYVSLCYLCNEYKLLETLHRKETVFFLRTYCVLLGHGVGGNKPCSKPIDKKLKYCNI